MFNSILYPMFAMVILTYLVLFRNVIARVASIRENPKTMNYYRAFLGQAPNDRIPQLKNHLANLFEFPLFFYLVSLVILITKVNDGLLMQLAWSYVALRLVHTVIHTTYNKVLHRMTAFALSNIVLVIMWVRVLLLQAE